MRVEDKALRQERVEQAFDRRAPAVGYSNPGTEGDLHDFVRAAGNLSYCRAVEELHQGLELERDDRLRREGRERGSTRLDVEDPVLLDRDVAAAAAREFRV